MSTSFIWNIFFVTVNIQPRRRDNCPLLNVIFQHMAFTIYLRSFLKTKNTSLRGPGVGARARFLTP